MILDGLSIKGQVTWSVPVLGRGNVILCKYAASPVRLRVGPNFQFAIFNFQFSIPPQAHKLIVCSRAGPMDTMASFAPVNSASA